LEPGTYELTFQVQRSQNAQARQGGEDGWSAPVTEKIHIASKNDVEWVMMLYMAGDYHDNDKQWNIFQRVLDNLNKTELDPNLRVVAQVDGYRLTPQRWIISPNEQESQSYEIDEVAMDSPDTLSAFLKWGQKEFPAKNYYLVVANHGQAVRGIAWDTTSDGADDREINNSAYLTIRELREALSAPGVDPVDVLHLDACSMNLFEVAYEVSKYTKVLVSSQYLGWDYFPYDQYAQSIGQNTDPIGLGRNIVDIYAGIARDYNQPHTISTLNMDHSANVDDTVNMDHSVVALNALNALAGNLVDSIEEGTISKDLLQEVRADAQSFDSDNDNQNNQDDLYIDLIDWASILRIKVGDEDIQKSATDLIAELDFVIGNSQVKGGNIGTVEAVLDRASGISIFYPKDRLYTTYQRYINHELFEFSRHSKWRDFLIATLGPVAEDDVPLPEPEPKTYLVGKTTPQSQTEPCTPESTDCKHIYLPIIVR